MAPQHDGSRLRSFGNSSVRSLKPVDRRARLLLSSAVSVPGTSGHNNFSTVLLQLLVLVGATGFAAVQPVAAARIHPTSAVAAYREIGQQAPRDDSSFVSLEVAAGTGVTGSSGLSLHADHHVGRAMLMDKPATQTSSASATTTTTTAGSKAPIDASKFSCAELVTLWPKLNVVIRDPFGEDKYSWPDAWKALEDLCECSVGYKTWLAKQSGPTGRTWPADMDPLALNTGTCQFIAKEQVADHTKYCKEKCLCKEDPKQKDDSLYRCIIARFFSPAGFDPATRTIGTFLTGPDLLQCLKNRPDYNKIFGDGKYMFKLPKDDPSDKSTGSCTGALVAEVKADEKALKTAEKKEENAAKEVKEATKDLVADTKVLSDAMKASGEKTTAATSSSADASTDAKVVSRPRASAAVGGIVKPPEKKNFEDDGEEDEGYGVMPRQSRYDVEEDSQHDSGSAPHLSSAWYEDDGEGGANHQQPTTSQLSRYADDEDQGPNDRFAAQQSRYADDEDDGDRSAPHQVESFEDISYDESDGDDK